MSHKILICMMTLLFSAGLLAQDNLLPNGNLESRTPNFWSEWNAQSGATLTWASDEAGPNPGNTALQSLYSFKVEKTAATTDWVGWQTENNADLYWNNAAGNVLYNFTFWAKTAGVNTAPANQDGEIGVWYKFYSGGSLVGESFVPVDQSVADKDWAQYTGALLVTAEPDEVYAYAAMGKDATGTVWFDNVDMTTDPWSMSLFNADAETPETWMYWFDAGKLGFANVVEVAGAPSGNYAVLLEEQDNEDDEMVFYSEPVPAVAEKWYAFGVWMKTEGMNTDPQYYASSALPDRDNYRAGVTFFFHRGPELGKSWDLTGGDQYFYVDQRNSDSDWAYYVVCAKAPEDAEGVSVRARFTSFPVGKVYYDDFGIFELDEAPNIVDNGDLETRTPNFWSEWNAQSGATLTWASDEAGPNPGNTALQSLYSFKVEKTAATTDWVGWQTENNADLYWNNAAGNVLYNFTFWAKTAGVNTTPANQDGEIGVWYKFYSGGSLVGESFVPVDQSVADKDWAQYTGALLVTAEPDEVYAYAAMGKDATGTVWFDNVDMTTDPWSMSLFNADAETPESWMYWFDAGKLGFANVVETAGAPSGTHAVLLEEQDNEDDEMVFYSEPFAAAGNEWYKFSFMVKSEGVNTDSLFIPTSVIPDRDNDRAGITILFHRGPDLEKSWDLTGGDQFVYIDQRTDSLGWVMVNAIAKAPEDAEGISVRARFTSFPVGKVWYDDFSIQHINKVITAIEPEPTPVTSLLPTNFKLMQNYPNPFNPETIIEYLVPENGSVELSIYNMLGQKVRTLVSGVRQAGTYQVHWDGTDNNGNRVSSGVYLYSLRGTNALITKKMVLMK